MGIDAPELYQYHVNTNTESEQFDVEIQTDQFAGDDEEDEQIDEEYLADWLDFIFPKLSQALDNNIRNDHFANYEVWTFQADETIKTLYGLKTNYEFSNQVSPEDAEDDESAQFQDYENDDDEYGGWGELPAWKGSRST